MAGGGTHPPKWKTSLYSEEQLQNAMQSVQSKRLFIKHPQLLIL